MSLFIGCLGATVNINFSLFSFIFVILAQRAFAGYVECFFDVLTANSTLYMDGVEDSLVRYNFVRIFIIFLFVHLTVRSFYLFYFWRRNCSQYHSGIS